MQGRSASPAVVKTLLLTDLVDSTRLFERVGDRRAAEISESHEHLARGLLGRFCGQEIDKTDGFLLLFERPVDAVGYALAFHEGLEELSKKIGEELEARVGIHLGEVVLRENSPEDVEKGAKPVEVEGLAKPTAARLMSLAGGRQTLLTQGAFDLARRATIGESLAEVDLEWLAHGPYVVQGVDEPVEIFEVGRPAFAPLEAPPDSEKAKRVALDETGGEAVETLGWRPALGHKVPGRLNWALTERLGEGGYGEVWLAEHEKTHAKRVFKFCFDPRRVRGLQREVVLFRLLKETLGQRDDIAQIIDWQFTKPPYFLESEYSEAGDLEAWLEEADAGLETRLELVAQTAVALGASHSVGVLHKDIKPQNILVTPGADGGPPRASLTDFGIGFVTEREALENKGVTIVGFTKTLLSSSSGSSGGTPLYLAPEVLVGDTATTRSDIYSLGVVLYQTIIGDFHRPLAPGWEREIDDELLREDIAACVDGTPERRIGDAAELAVRLRGLEERRRELAEAERLREEARLLRREGERHRKRKRQFTLATIAGVTLTLAVGVAALRESRLRQAAEEDQYFANVQLASVRLEEGQTGQARGLLLDTPERLRGWEWGHLVDRAWPAERVGERIVPTAGQTTAELWKDAQSVVVATLPADPQVVTSSFSVDGSLLLSSSYRGTARLFDVASEQLVLEVPTTAIAALSRDATRLATPQGLETAIWDVPSGERIGTLSGHANVVEFIRFTDDGDRLAEFSLENIIVVWDVEAEERILTISGQAGPEGQAFNDFRFSSDDVLWALSGTQQRLELWDVVRGALVRVVSGPGTPGFLPVGLSPDLTVVVSASPSSSRFMIWDAATGSERFVSGPRPGLYSRFVSFSADSTVAAVARGSTFLLFEVRTGREITSLHGGSQGFRNQRVGFSPDGSRMAVTDAEGTIQILAPARRFDQGPDVLRGHSDVVFVSTYSTDGTQLLSVSLDGTAIVWDQARGEPTAKLQGHEGEVNRGWFSPDGRLVLTSSYDDTSRLWDAATGELLFTFNRGSPVSSFDPRSTPLRYAAGYWTGRRFSPDGTRVIVDSPGNSASVIDTTSGEVILKLPEHSRFVVHLEYSSDGERVLTQPQFQGLRVWDARTGEELGSLDGHENSVWQGTFGPEGRHIATASADGTARLWDAATGEELHVLSEHLEMLNHTTFSPSGSLVATSAQDDTTKVWDVESGELLATLSGHTDDVNQAEFSPDGTRLLTVSFDDTVKVWTLDGKQLASLPVDGLVYHATWSPDGSTIAVSSSNGTVKLWRTIPWPELSEIGDGEMPFEERLAEWRRRARD